MSKRSIAAVALFAAGCVAEPQEPEEATILAEVALPSGATYRFVGVPDEDGTLANIGIVEATLPGHRSIQDVREVRGLDAVSVFRALAPADEPPARLVEVAARAG